MNSHTQSDRKHLVFYFQVHQPKRLNNFGFFDIGSNQEYFNNKLDEEIVNRIAKQCYLPVNNMLLKLIRSNPDVKITFSISGTALEQFENYTPEVIDSFKRLAETGSVEFLGETNYHSLASMLPGNEFEVQVKEHTKKIEQLFGTAPSVFRNTELIYNDEIGSRVMNMGFKGILSEGCEHILGNRSAYQLYHHRDDERIKLLLRSNRLSDDIAFRFHHGKNKLTVPQYVGWLRGLAAHDRVVVLGMDYETFGEHHKADSGIQAFLETLLVNLAEDKRFQLSTPSDVLQTITSVDHFAAENAISWADKDKDMTAWLGNDMQLDAFATVIGMEADVKKSHNTSLLTTWRNLLTSDHFYYMATKNGDDDSVHAHFSHYKSPYEAFMNYMNILSDFAVKVKSAPVDEAEAAIHQEIERRTHLPPVWVEERAAAYKYEAVMGGR